MKSRVIEIMVVATLAAAAPGCRRGEPPPTPPAATAPDLAAAPGEIGLAEVPAFVSIAAVESTSEAGVTAATGKVGFDEERVSRVSSPVSGRVVELLAHPGDRVRRGQGLLVIASPDAQAAAADYVAAQADRALAERTLERLKRLYAEQAVPGKDVVQAESDATKAAASMARAASRLEVLGIDPSSPDTHATRFVLRSPLDGVVVERAAFPGMEVRPDSGTPLVTVADLTRLWVLADVYERDLARVQAGAKAVVRVVASPGKTWEGKVTHVGDLVDASTRTVKLRIEVANPTLELKPEMFARVTLQAPPSPTPELSVPSSALLSDGETSAVVVALGKGRFQKRAVETGAETEGRVHILSGLAAGDRVVVDGALFLKAAIDGR
jgi:cobalt-zinc-cadmium efflux system membrane fusion protein